jgi:hypothetical protein
VLTLLVIISNAAVIVLLSLVAKQQMTGVMTEMKTDITILVTDVTNDLNATLTTLVNAMQSDIEKLALDMYMVITSVDADVKSGTSAILTAIHNINATRH